MLSNNLPDLEVCLPIIQTMSTKLISKKVLVFVDVNHQLHNTVNADGILSSTQWPRLRILDFMAQAVVSRRSRSFSQCILAWKSWRSQDGRLAQLMHCPICVTCSVRPTRLRLF